MEKPVIPVIIDFLIDLFLFLFPLSFVSREMRLRPKALSDLKPAMQKLGFRGISPKKFLKQAALIFAALALLGVALNLLLALAQANDLGKVAEGIESIVEISPILLLYFLLVRVFTEEVFFRGFLVNKAGILPSTLLFAVAHALYGSYAEVLGAFLLGLVLATAFKKTQNLLPVIAAHILYNLFALILIFGVI
jgi:membrane protease YdiL (CAAX protease family)